MATGWDNGLCQDYCRGLSLWFSSRLDARHTIRKHFMTQPNTQAPADERGAQRFTKKPVTIEATQWFKHGDHPAVTSIPADHPIDRNCIDPAAFGWVPTLEGGHIVTPGDWIITGVKGEHYPCKPDIFAATYEPAALASQPAQADVSLINEGNKPAQPAPVAVAGLGRILCDDEVVTLQFKDEASADAFAASIEPSIEVDGMPPLRTAAPVAVDERPDCFEFAMDFLGGLDAEKVRAYVETLEARVALLSARSGQASSHTRLICDSCGHRGVESEFLRAGTYICPACGDADVSEDGGDAGGARMPGLTSGVVNDVCWKFVEALPHQLPGPIWNDLKPAMYEALKLFHAQVATPSAPVQAGQVAGEDAAQDDQPPEGKQWFYCTTTVTIVQGWQQWRVAASSLEEAKAVFEEEGGEFVGEELEVQYFDSPEWERAANKEGQSHE